MNNCTFDVSDTNCIRNDYKKSKILKDLAPSDFLAKTLFPITRLDIVNWFVQGPRLVNVSNLESTSSCQLMLMLGLNLQLRCDHLLFEVSVEVFNRIAKFLLADARIWALRGALNAESPPN